MSMRYCADGALMRKQFYLTRYVLHLDLTIADFMREVHVSCVYCLYLYVYRLDKNCGQFWHKLR